MDRKSVLLALVRRALMMRRNSDELANLFAEVQEREVRRQMNGFFGVLGNLILRHAGQPGGFRLVSGMLKELDIQLDLSSVQDIYEKTGAETVRYIQEAEKLMQKADPAVEFVFDEIDTATLEMIRNSFFWMKADHSEGLIAEVKAVIEAAFAGEIARDALPGYLEDKFGSIVKAESRYFKDVSDHIISQGQNMARVNQGSKYGVRWYKIMAKMDERTTRFCRSVNGKIISAAHAEKQSKKILSAKNSYEKKNAAAWPKNDSPFCGKTLPENIGIPPYHYRCRTILQPVWLSDEEVRVMGDPVWVRNTRPNTDADILFRHVDKTGVEREVPKALYDPAKHISDKPEPNKIVKALNSIVRYAPHSGDENRTVAVSANGFLMIFEGNRMVTIFKPGDIKKAFGKTALTNMAEVIKWSGRWLFI